MSDNVVLIGSVSLIIIFSPFFAKILKLPTTPIEIVLGSIFTYFGLLHDEHLFEIVAELGFLYLMFIAGTEINLKTFVKISLSTAKRIGGYLLILYGLSLLFAFYFHLSNIFIVLLPLISVGLIATLSKEYGTPKWLDIAMKAGAIGEVVSIVILTLTSSALEEGFGIKFIETVGYLTLFLVVMFVLFRAVEILFWWYPKVATTLMPHDDKLEQDVRLSMGIFFLLVGVMLYLHLELAFGAFLAGIFLPTFFEHKHELHKKLASFGFGFLIPIFFIHIGSSFYLEALVMDGLILKASLIALMMVVMRLIASSVFIDKLGLKDAMLVGLSHSMPLTLLIAMATLAFQAKSIDLLHYYAFILAALFQVISIMVVIKLLNRDSF